MTARTEAEHAGTAQIHYSVESAENLIADRRNLLSTDMAKETIICVKCYADWFNLSDCIFLFIVFVYFSLLKKILIFFVNFFSFMLC